MKPSDQDLLAYDLADLLDRHGYAVDAGAEEIRDALPAFLEQLASGPHTDDGDDDDWEHGQDAANWTPADADEPPALQTGKAPRMTYAPWMTSQGVQIGATGREEHFWRCPFCRVWAGPYADASLSKRRGLDHRFHAHDRPAGRRSEALKAAKRLGPTAMSAATFDRLVDDLATAYGLSPDASHQIIGRVADTIRGYSSPLLLDSIDRDHLVPAGHDTADVLGTITARLGYPGWLERRAA